MSKTFKKHPKALPDILSQLHEADRFPVLTARDGDDRTLLISSVESVEGLLILLQYYPENAHVPALKEKGSDGQTLLSKWLNARFIRDPRLLPTILNYYPPEERFDALMDVKQDNYPLHRLARDNYACLVQILILLPERHQQFILKQRDANGKMLIALLPRAASKDVLTFLSLFQPEERCDVMREQNEFGETVFDTLVKTKANLDILQTLMSKEDVLTLLKESLERTQGSRPKKTLREYAGSPEHLLALLELFPQDERLAVLELNVIRKNDYVSTWSSIATQKPPILLEILELLPEEDPCEAMMARNQFGETIFQVIEKKDPKISRAIRNKLLNIMPDFSGNNFVSEREHIIAWSN